MDRLYPLPFTKGEQNHETRAVWHCKRQGREEKKGLLKHTFVSPDTCKHHLFHQAHDQAIPVCGVQSNV